MTEKIREALQTLDPANPEHWTSEGLPRVDVLANAVGDQTLSRADVTAAAPAFCRDNPSFEAPPPAEKPTAEPTQDELVSALAVAEGFLDTARAARDEAQAVFQRAQVEVDALRAAVDRRQAQEGDQTMANIQAYLATQKARKQAEGEMAMELRKNGVDKLMKLLPKQAPIDAAMARKRAHGAQRPVRQGR